MSHITNMAQKENFASKGRKVDKHLHLLGQSRRVLVLNFSIRKTLPNRLYSLRIVVNLRGHHPSQPLPLQLRLCGCTATKCTANRTTVRFANKRSH